MTSDFIGHILEQIDYLFIDLISQGTELTAGIPLGVLGDMG